MLKKRISENIVRNIKINKKMVKKKSMKNFKSRIKNNNKMLKKKKKRRSNIIKDRLHRLALDIYLINATQDGF